jgi:hypothetical protein
VWLLRGLDSARTAPPSGACMVDAW